MIVILSNSRERGAFAALSAANGLTATECESVRAFVRLIRRTPPGVVLARRKLIDGYTDDIIAALSAADLLESTKVIVLVGAADSATLEARQLALGADCVLRDPVKSEVLLAYLAKYAAHRATPDGRLHMPRESVLEFAGAAVSPVERTARYGNRVVTITPREIQLIEVLLQARDAVVSYDTLYGEVLQRRFGGDTSNMRVLLGKLAGSLATIGVAVRQWIEVIPKGGYRYREPAVPAKASAA